MKTRSGAVLFLLAAIFALTISACTSAGPAHVGVSVHYGYGYGPGWGSGWYGGYRPPRPIGPPPGSRPRPVQLPQNQ
jgi:hypothetical protein